MRDLYDTAEVDVDLANELYPFRGGHLAGLNNLRTRDALDFLRRHHQQCITSGQWEDPGVVTPPPVAPVENDLDALWNDSRSAFQGTVPDGEEELADVLADAIWAAGAELPDGFHFDCSAARAYLEVETHKPDNSVTKRLVAVCNASTRGVAFGKQVSELEERADEIPVVIVRTTDFPKTGKAIAQIAGMLKRHGEKVVAADAEWRRMLAFEAFRKRHEQRREFAAWQKAARPLGELDSLQKILKLSSFAASRACRSIHRRRLFHQNRPTRLRRPSTSFGPGRRKRGAAHPWPHGQRKPGPRHLRPERVCPTCGVPRRDGKRQDDGRPQPDRTTARP